MGINRDNRHKRRATGGKRAIHQKKRKYELGRPSARTKLGGDTVHLVRCRGNNIKKRALRVEYGAFSLASRQMSARAKIVSVVYNATSNEYVRTNTVTKNGIVQIDATPFRNLFYTQYGIELGKKRVVTESTEAIAEGKEAETTEEKKQSKHVLAKIAKRAKGLQLDAALEEQFASGRLYACITSRPGQTGAANGYILEGEELAFYKKKLDKKKKN